MAVNPASDANPAEVAEQQARCFVLKLAGHSVRSVAKEVGLSVTTTQRRLQAAYDDLVQPVAAEARAIEVERYDVWQLRLERHMETIAGDINQAELLVKLTNTAKMVSERRARLLGLDAPVAVEARGDLRVTVIGVDLGAVK